MEPRWAIVAFVIVPLLIMLLMSWYIQSSQRKRYDKLIEGYTATIQKLMNREPVTYAEVGEKSPKRSTERYVAWGNQTMDMEDE